MTLWSRYTALVRMLELVIVIVVNCKMGTGEYNFFFNHPPPNTSKHLGTNFGRNKRIVLPQVIFLVVNFLTIYLSGALFQKKTFLNSKKLSINNKD